MAQVGVRKADDALAGSSANASKRLQSELMSLMMSGVVGVSAFPDGDNLFKWAANIIGPADTVYEGLSFKLSIEFASNYPFKAPLVKFETPCFHPNVDLQGFICLDILKEKWSAVYTVQNILLSIQSLLGEPNNESPLNSHAAGLWANQNEFKKLVLAKHGEPVASTPTPVGPKIR